MARDVKFWKEDGSFKLRVCGIIQQDDKYLINQDQVYGGFYTFPGGHVILGEDTDSAVIRELKEETSILTKIEKLLIIEQLFFDRDDKMPFHEICYYYLLSPKQKLKIEDFEYTENDKGEIKHYNYKWLTLEELEKMDVRPKTILDAIKNGQECQSLIRKA